MSARRELMEKFFRDEEMERIPVSFWFHFLDDDVMERGLERPELLTMQKIGQKAYIEKFDPDFIKVMTDGIFDRPMEEYPVIEKAEDLYQMKPLPKDHPYFAAHLDVAKSAREAAADDRFMFYNIFSPLENLEKALRAQDCKKSRYELIQEDEKAVMYALDCIAEDMSYVAELVLTEGGMDGLFLSVNDHNKIIPEDTYLRVVSPSELKILEKANSITNYQLLHICGYHGADNYVRLYKDYPARAFNWAVFVEDMDIAEGKKFFNKPIFGGFDQNLGCLLQKGTEDEIRAFTRDLCEKMGSKGFCIGADCTVPRDTHWTHYEWVRDEADKFMNFKGF